MNSTLYSDCNRLVPANVLKFRCRLDSADGRDVHRQFSGAYYPRWRALYLDELREVLGRGEFRVVPLFPFAVYYKQSQPSSAGASSSGEEEHFYTEDFYHGAKLFLGKTASDRDRAAKMFVITSVDQQALQTPTASDAAVRAQLRERGVPESALGAVSKVREAFIARAGGYAEMGIKDIGRRFRIADADGSRRVSRAEFARSLKDAHVVDLGPGDVDAVFSAFDANSDGSISYDELLNVLRGPMSERRKALVAQVFRKLDVNGDGQITLHDIRGRYHAAKHPDVLSGALTADQVLAAFLSVWDTRDQNGSVSFAEFCDYYNGVSASIDTDDLFEAVIVSSWKLLS